MTSPRLLADDLLLLAYHDRDGRPTSSTSSQLPTALGGALLLDLALRDRLRIEVDVPRISPRPTGEPVLDEVAALLRAGPARRKLKGWVRKVGTSSRRRQLLARLVDHGRLHAEDRRVLGLLPVTRYRLTDPADAAQLAARVRAVLCGERPADDHEHVLAALVGATALTDQLLPRSERRAARRRARELAEDAPIAAAARDVIRETQAAVVAAVAAAGATAGR